MEDGNADVYFVDTRNADHRAMRPTIVPPRQPSYVPATTGQRVTYAGPAYAPAPMYGQGFWGSPPPMYVQAPAWGQPGTLGSLFGGLNSVNIGSLIDLIGQGFAAIRSLPTPPTASGESGVDVANLTLYQQALAEHGKTDEQIRTAVHIIGKLLGA